MPVEQDVIGGASSSEAFRDEAELVWAPRYAMDKKNGGMAAWYLAYVFLVLHSNLTMMNCLCFQKVYSPA